MEKNISFIDYKSRDFYFLHLKKLSDEGVTNHKWQEHSFYEIMLVTEGESEYVIENRRYDVKKGDLLLIKPGRHHYKHRVIKTPSTVYCLGFLPGAIAVSGLAEKIFDTCEYFSLTDNSPVIDMFYATAKKLEITKSNASHFIKSVAEATVLLLCDLDISIQPPAKVKNRAVEKILAYINDNLCSIRKISDITGALFFSESYARAAFKKEMGIGIMEYVRNKKVLFAHRKIRHGKKPTEIYAECGFSNYPSFYRAYRSYMGSSPNTQKI